MAKVEKVSDITFICFPGLNARKRRLSESLMPTLSLIIKKNMRIN